MAYNKTQIYNLALSALKLSRQFSDVETENTSNEVKTLNNIWDIAYKTTLQDLDIDSIAITEPLELIDTLDYGPWTYVYKYPSNCTFLRKIENGVRVDNMMSHISKKTGVYNNQKAIFTNQHQACASFIPHDVALEFIPPMGAMAIAYQLAFLASPLITGKGAKTLQDQLEALYRITVEKARQIDANENFNYDTAAERSEFVATRLE